MRTKLTHTQSAKTDLTKFSNTIKFQLDLNKVKKTPIVTPQVQHRLKNNKSKNNVKKKDSVTPPELTTITAANTERKNNFNKTIDLGTMTGH